LSTLSQSDLGLKKEKKEKKKTYKVTFIDKVEDNKELAKIYIVQSYKDYNS
jgi:hypothetical protein